MTRLKLSLLANLLGLTAAASMAFVPTAAAGQQVVPPGNSAANQYTEAIPTTDGEKKTTKKDEKRNPAAVLGPRKAHKLEAAGPEGRRAAAIAAATSPVPESDRSEGASVGNGDTARQRPNRNAKHPSSEGERSQPIDVEGSSGLGNVVKQATGWSGQGGPIVSIAIIAAIAGSLLYLWRRKRPLP
jgi:hypothetical protein